MTRSQRRREFLAQAAAVGAVALLPLAQPAAAQAGAPRQSVKLPRTNPGSPFASMKGHHVAVRVPSFEAALAWYTEKLDFRVVHQWPYADQKLAYIAPANDNHFFVELLGGGTPPPVPKPRYSDLGDSLRLAGYHHFCINVDDMEATVAELRRRGVHVVTEPFELPVIGRKLAFIADPFGNLIELAQVLV